MQDQRKNRPQCCFTHHSNNLLALAPLLALYLSKLTLKTRLICLIIDRRCLNQRLAVNVESVKELFNGPDLNCGSWIFRESAPAQRAACGSEGVQLYYLLMTSVFTWMHIFLQKLATGFGYYFFLFVCFFAIKRVLRLDWILSGPEHVHRRSLSSFIGPHLDFHKSTPVPYAVQNTVLFSLIPLLIDSFRRCDRDRGPRCNIHLLAKQCLIKTAFWPGV